VITQNSIKRIKFNFPTPWNFRAAAFAEYDEIFVALKKTLALN